MPREKESYRDNVELLREEFPGQIQLNKCVVAKYLGVDPRSVKKHVKVNEFGKISISDLARAISG